MLHVDESRTTNIKPKIPGGLHFYLLLWSTSWVEVLLNLRAQVLFSLPFESGPPPIQKHFQQIWPGLGQSQSIWGGFDMMTVQMSALWGLFQTNTNL